MDRCKFDKFNKNGMNVMYFWKNYICTTQHSTFECVFEVYMAEQLLCYLLAVVLAHTHIHIHTL